MVTTNDEALWRSMWAFKDHGKSYEAVYERAHTPGFRWLHDSFGTNWRMLEIQAVIGRIQLTRMAGWTSQRKHNAETIWGVCSRYRVIRVPSSPEGHAHYKCYIYIRRDFLADGWTRDRIVSEISSCGVPCFQGSCSEVYLEKAFDGTGWRPVERLPVAKELGETSVMFLVHPTLTQEELQKMCDVIDQVLSRACR